MCCSPAISNEPQHSKTNKMTCATSKDSDQPGNPPSLAIACAQWIAKDVRLLRADSEDDQTGRLPILICVLSSLCAQIIYLVLSSCGPVMEKCMGDTDDVFVQYKTTDSVSAVLYLLL